MAESPVVDSIAPAPWREVRQEVPMPVTTLAQVEESLHGLDPETLQEMAFQLARSHAAVCGVTSRVGGCAHVDATEMRDRVDALTVSEMIGLLAPAVWVSIDSHRRLAD
jgi:hypothetical protein